MSWKEDNRQNKTSRRQSLSLIPVFPPGASTVNSKSREGRAWRMEPADLGSGRSWGWASGSIQEQEKHGERTTEGVGISSEKDKPQF